jgi:hypothetical protein
MGERYIRDSGSHRFELILGDVRKVLEALDAGLIEYLDCTFARAT